MQHQLTMEQLLELQQFEIKSAFMDDVIRKQLLISLYRHQMLMDNYYKEKIKQQWGFSD